jgi:hypothetical protein
VCGKDRKKRSNDRVYILCTMAAKQVKIVLKDGAGNFMHQLEDRLRGIFRNNVCLPAVNDANERIIDQLKASWKDWTRVSPRTVLSKVYTEFSVLFEEFQKMKAIYGGGFNWFQGQWQSY